MRELIIGKKALRRIQMGDVLIVVFEDGRRVPCVVSSCWAQSCRECALDSVCLQLERRYGYSFIPLEDAVI